MSPGQILFKIRQAIRQRFHGQTGSTVPEAKPQQPSVDTEAPILETAEINDNTITLSYNEPIKESSIPDTKISRLFVQMKKVVP